MLSSTDFHSVSHKVQFNVLLCRPAGRAATESGSINGARTRPTAGMLDTSAANSPVHLQHRLTPKGGSIHGDKQKNCKKFGNQGQDQGC